MRTISILTLSILFLAACGSGHLNRGDAAFHHMHYKKAAHHYEKALGKINNPLIHAKAAEAYVKMNETQKAEAHYAVAVLSEEASPEIKYRYAQMLLTNGKEAKGRAWMEKYLKENPSDSLAHQWTTEKAAKGSYAEFDASRIQVELIPLIGYSSTFAAYPFKDGIYFVGEKDPMKGDMVNPWNGKSFLDIYRVDKVLGNEWINPVIVKGEMNKVLHDGPLSLSPDGKTAYLTRSAMDDSDRRKLDEKAINQLKIVQLNLEDGNWKLNGELPLNRHNCSSMHPNICQDKQTLFFSSDRAGGQGGSDLYMAIFDGQTWSEPQNLGPEINTPRNEGFPFALHRDTLFFASDGHGGMGGLDIFISIWDGKNWSTPRNLKAPINTNFDDFSLYRYEGGMSGYLSSNRSGKDEIYNWRVSDPEFLIVGKVIDIDKDPVPYAKVLLTEAGKHVDSTETNRSGNFKIAMDWEKKYEVAGVHKIQKTDTVVVSSEGKKVSETFKVELQLEGPQLTVHGVVLNKRTKERMPGVQVELSKETGSTALSSLESNDKGEFLFQIERNEEYKLHGFLKNHFSRKVGLSTKGQKESKTYEVVIYLEEVEVSKPIVLNNIYYDYDKYDIRDDAVGDLENLLSFMQENPNIKIELSAHTDARGTDQYNNWLSGKRAEAASNYLVKNGIDPSRMLHVGYGEKELVNECKDGVRCSEEKHQENRRTEFKVLQLEF